MHKAWDSVVQGFCLRFGTNTSWVEYGCRGFKVQVLLVRFWVQEAGA